MLDRVIDLYVITYFHMYIRYIHHYIHVYKAGIGKISMYLMFMLYTGNIMGPL